MDAWNRTEKPVAVVACGATASDLMSWLHIAIRYDKLARTSSLPPNCHDDNLVSRICLGAPNGPKHLFASG
jgi:hypothetical protein